jgi:hypothetical protein
MVGRIPFAFLKRPPSQEEHTTVYSIQKTFSGTTSSLCRNFQNLYGEEVMGILLSLVEAVILIFEMAKKTCLQDSLLGEIRTLYPPLISLDSTLTN